MILKINGLDITPYIEQKGIKWTRNDLDGSNAGRTMDGIMHRERVSSKVRLDITCLPLRSEDAAIVLNAIYPEYVEVEYIDPMYGRVFKTMYSNNTPATFIDTVTDLWEGISFPLIER
jgi:hypothetical protein